MLSYLRFLPLVTLATTVACSSTEPPVPGPPSGAEVARSAKARISSPPTTDVATLGDANRGFAFDLYAELRSADDAEDNLFLSPYSISAALAMTYAGAEGETESQMASVLHFDFGEDRLHPAFNATDLELTSRGEQAAGSDSGPFRLNIVNQTWGQKGYVFEASYLDLLAEHYGAGMYLLDFAADPESSRITINDWVADQTEDRIRDLIPPGVVTPITTLVLTNAIYFNAAWNLPFEEEDTADGAFTLLDASMVTVPLMHQTKEHDYAEGDGWQAVELPYDAEELSMIVVLPAEGRFAEIEAQLDDAFFVDMQEQLHGRMVTVTLPRFGFESTFGLNEPLMALGMTDAFSGGVADFSGIDTTRSLFIQAVLHKAFVAVNEAGTEAAAATAVIVGRVSAPEPAEIEVVRPFLFFIVDQPTGEVLFLGRVLDPSS